MSPGWPAGRKQPFKLQGGDDVGETAQAVFLGKLGLVSLESGGQDDRTYRDLFLADAHVVVDGLGITGIFAGQAFGADAALQASLRFCPGLVLGQAQHHLAETGDPLLNGQQGRLRPGGGLNFTGGHPLLDLLAAGLDHWG